MAKKNDGSAPLLDDETLKLLARQLRGMTHAKLRFIGGDPAQERAISDALLALGISSESEHIPDFAPSPQRRYSFRFEGTTAVLTVALAVQPDHY
ncbi:hypothetical protein [Paracoccus aminophilus]|uniref:hypothetical protein n=1 Tax=Paracoccus aminophilus TaxID=34003 RepID=UPI0011DE087D|nr:hypothetical protein [Paracoccus aminophilus]